MLSTNLREIAEYVNQMAGLWMEENDDQNMAFAWGVAIGTILRIAGENEKRGN